MDTSITLGVGTTLGIGTAIAAGVAILKQAFPALPSRAIPLIVLVLSGVLVGLGVASGSIARDPLAIALQIVSQTASTMGIREGVVAALPGASALPTVMGTSSGAK